MDNDKKYYLKFYTLHSSGSLNLNAVLIIESKFHIYFFTILKNTQMNRKYLDKHRALPLPCKRYRKQSRNIEIALSTIPDMNI